MPTSQALMGSLLLVISTALGNAEVRPDEALEAGRQAYEACEYHRATELLRQAAESAPQNGEIHLLLAQSYYEAEQRDAAITSAERAVALDPKNSVYHEWLGKVYGEKADHSGMFSALSLAKKARREFQKAVELNETNFSAYQALIEFDCSAPGIAGGGEDKARPEIARVQELNAAEGHYAAGNCRRQKKDFAKADEEFDQALASHPASANLIYDIGDYAMKHNQAERLLAVVAEGERAAPGDARGGFYRGVAWVIRNQHGEEAEGLLRQYLSRSIVRNNFPHPWTVHEWLGRLYESRDEKAGAIQEYETALKLDPKTKNAREALKRLKKS
jgi:tetratricopeptide (TPR) repeat protein